MTGATGFVGRQIMRFLNEQGVDIIAVVREGKETEIQALSGVCRIIVTSDLFAESSEWWSNACFDVDTIIHSAWYAEPGKYLQSSLNLDCLIGTLSLARGAAQAGVRRIVGIGTCFEYDFGVNVLSVASPLRPLTPYGSAKAAAFMMLSQWLPIQPIEFAWCRLFYLYGEGENERRLVPYLRAHLAAGEIAELTSGRQVRDFMDVSDAGRLIAEIALGSQKGPINICSGIPVTVRELAEKIADEYGRRDLLKFGARPDNLVDPPCVIGLPGGEKSVNANT